MLKPSPAADKINASVQTSTEAPSSFIWKNVSDDVEESVMKDKDRVDAAESNIKAVELEKVCNEQATKMEELNYLVEQLKTEKENYVTYRNCQATEHKGCDAGESIASEIIKEMCAIKNNKSENESFHMREKEELTAEITSLKSKLRDYTDTSAPNKSIGKLRSSLLSRSIQRRKSMSSQFNNVQELEKERERWTEKESEWINLTDELRIDIESHLQHAEKVKLELQQEKKYTEELGDAIHRAVIGHAQFVEHYVDLQEKYEHLSEKREREPLRKENKSLRFQLRETAEAVQTAVQHDRPTARDEKLRKQIDKLKNKHKMEMLTMKQYMAESRLLESASKKPVHFDDVPLPTSTFTTPHDDESWRSEFSNIYQHDRY